MKFSWHFFPHSVQIFTFLTKESIKKAPIGAVINMASTNTVSIISPAGKPNDSGTEPTAACTVAFGKYAIIQNYFSFNVNLVLDRERKTPIMRIAAKTRIRSIGINPAAIA